ncbi:MAG: MFS transporter, partial [Chloroflexota bacterium]
MTAAQPGTASPHPTSFPALVAVATIVNALILGIRLVASYRALDLGADAFALGVVAAAFAILPVLLAVPLGRLTDRHGEPLFLVLGGILMAAATLLTLAADTLALLALSQAALGIGQLMSVIASQTLVGRWFPTKAARSGRFGHYAAGAAVGQLLGPIAGGAIVAAGADGSALLLGSLLLVAPGIAGVGLAAWIMVHEGGAPRVGADGTRAPWVPAMTILRWPGMGRTMVASLAINLGVDMLIVFLPAYGEANGLGVETVAALLALRSATAIGARVLTGRVARKLGDGRALRVVIAVAAFAYLTIPLTASPVVLAVQIVLLGLGLGLGQPLTLAWVAATSPPDAMGTAIAVRLTGNRVAQLIASGGEVAATHASVSGCPSPSPSPRSTIWTASTTGEA